MPPPPPPPPHGRLSLFFYPDVAVKCCRVNNSVAHNVLHLPVQREHLGSPDSRVLDGEDLLDDVLTAPSNHRRHSHTPTNDDEVRYWARLLLWQGVREECRERKVA